MEHDSIIKPYQVRGSSKLRIGLEPEYIRKFVRCSSMQHFTWPLQTAKIWMDLPCDVLGRLLLTMLVYRTSLGSGIARERSGLGLTVDVEIALEDCMGGFINRDQPYRCC